MICIFSELTHSFQVKQVYAIRFDSSSTRSPHLFPFRIQSILCTCSKFMAKVFHSKRLIKTPYQLPCVVYLQKSISVDSRVIIQTENWRKKKRNEILSIELIIRNVSTWGHESWILNGVNVLLSHFSCSSAAKTQQQTHCLTQLHSLTTIQYIILMHNNYGLIK